MPKTRAFNAAKYRDNPKMIARYLNTRSKRGMRSSSRKRLAT
jgi:hypothetical protein